jgi:hypothetical protein
MDAGLIVPSIDAAIELATFVRSSYALFRAGHMTDSQLRAAWRAAGLAVADADRRWEAAGKEGQPGS